MVMIRLDDIQVVDAYPCENNQKTHHQQLLSCHIIETHKNWDARKTFRLLGLAYLGFLMKQVERQRTTKRAARACASSHTYSHGAFELPP